jgi:predicted nucleic acid-binding protein
MAGHYFDTSALCRRYHTEPGSDVVERVFAEAGATQYVSWLTVLETQSAFALKVRTGEITETKLALLRTRLLSDIRERQLLVVRVLRRHYDHAGKLLMTYGPTVRLRSLDALHLAIALDLQQRGLAQKLFTADSAMISVGTQEGLTIINPLSSASRLQIATE